MRRPIQSLCVLCVIVCPPTLAQTTCTPQSKLFCLVPNQLGTKSDEFTALNEAVGTVVSDLPLASPASGVIYTIDPSLKVPVPVNTTLGPVLTQRPETVGRHRMYFAAVYQYFRFEDIDGISLKALPSVTKTTDLAFVTTSRLNLTVHQVVGYFTFGLTSRVDVSVAVPILDVQEQFTSVGSKIILSASGTPPTPINISNSGSVSGLGDVVIAAKGTIWKPSAGGLAAGVEVRVPSGDEQNFLGAGTTGVKPYLSLAYGKRRLSFHGNVAYQVNGDTSLANGHLPNRLFYSGGTDWGVRKWMTIAVDVLAERVFDAHRIEITASAVNADNFPSIKASPTSAYNRTDGSAGIKLKPYRNLIITGNVLIKLDQGGLRTRMVPLAGISYTF
jgi:hypothetical protein